MLTAIVDLQFGSTGKGLLAGFLSMNNDYDAVVSANMPNAGHTFVDNNGKAWVHKVLPSGVYSPGLKYVMVGPGAVFSIARLGVEVDFLRQQGIEAQVVVHPQAGVLLEEHRDAEQAGLSHISSTMQGSMEALVQKMRRGPNANVATSFRGEISLMGATVATSNEWHTIMRDAKNVLVEGSQGYSLGIHAGFYPYCTSRDCTIWRLIADAGVIVKDQIKVIGSARVHPIRVGNTADGYSGDCYPDQQETSWEALGQTPEKTTVTQRVRRVFTFSPLQIFEAMEANRVDEVFLNFCNYDAAYAIHVKAIIDDIGQKIAESHRGRPDWLDGEPIVRYMGFGPAAAHVLDLRPGNVNGGA